MISAPAPAETVYFWTETRETGSVVKHRCRSGDKIMTVGETCDYCGVELTLPIAQSAYDEAAALIVADRPT